MNNKDKHDHSSDIEIEDLEEYRGGKGASFKEIVLRHFSKCIAEGSKAIDFGGVQTRMIEGRPISIVVPNQVEIFINSVEMLKRVLENKIRTFKEIGEGIAKIYRRIEDLEKKFFVATQKVREEFGRIERKKASDYTQLNAYIEEIRRDMERRKYGEYKNIFTELSLLLAMMNYFEEDSIIWEQS